MATRQEWNRYMKGRNPIAKSLRRKGAQRIESGKAYDRQEKRIADRIDGYDRDDLGESPDY